MSVPESTGFAPIRLPSPCLVVLIGPSGTGKSSWCRRHLDPSLIVSSDALRSLVGEGEHDLRASGDAFAVLGDVVARRCRRKLTTVIDTLGTDAKNRSAWVAQARQAGLPTVAVVFDVAEKQARAWNRARARQVPADALRSQWKSFESTRSALDGVDVVITLNQADLDRPVRFVNGDLVHAVSSAQRQKEQPMSLRFGLQVSRFPEPASEHGSWLGDVARAAEDAGFRSFWVMDHFRQIPQVGRAWDDMLDSWTTLAYVAARTSTIRLGTMVTGVTYRNVGHLGKIVATLDVLSGGRAVCGVGAAWFKAEHDAFAWTFPSAAQRLDLLADAVPALRMLWGPGGGPFDGKVLQLPDTAAYPRPLQERGPVLVGGGGEKRTLRIAAEHADAVNVAGDLATIRRKHHVLRAHMDAIGRPHHEVRMTALVGALVGSSDADVDERIDALGFETGRRDRLRAQLVAGTVDEQIGRFRDLADAGVGTVVVSLRDVSPESVARFRPVIDAFSDGTPQPGDDLLTF